MTPTQLANALRDVEVANEETNYAKFQSDAAIVEEAAGMLEKQERMIELQDRLLNDYRANYVPKER